MANIQTYLDNISNAVYGEEVRGSIHDAIDIINKVSEKVATLGTAITSTNSPVTGYYRDSLYLNIQTWDLWKCTGTAWENQGNLKGVNISQVVKKSSSNNVDTYDIRLSNNTSAGEFTVSNSNKIGLGIDVTSTNTSTLIGSTQYYANDIYINSSTWSVWECNGTGWTLKGVIEGPKGDTGDKGDKGDTGEQGLKGDPGFSPTITATKEGKVTTLTITDVTGTQSPIQIRDGDDGSGSGDMLKSTYDRDNDGVVDESKTISASSIDTVPTAGSNNFLKSGALYSIIGSLANLDTTDKSNLVAAINEAMQSGSSIDLPLSIANGGTGNSDGYIQTGHNGNSDIGANATIEGLNNEASGRQAHAEGIGSHAIGNQSHAEGRTCQAYSDYSHAEGLNTWTDSNVEAQHVCGKYNNNKNDTLLEVGNGTASDLNSRSNAFEVTIDGYIRTHNNATKIAFGVDENGNYGYIKAGADTVTPFKNPTGTKQITTNGTHDVTDFASAEVSVLNTNTATFTYPSGASGGTYDMGYNNFIRYVNASNVYNTGKADARVTSMSPYYDLHGFAPKDSIQGENGSTSIVIFHTYTGAPSEIDNGSILLKINIDPYIIMVIKVTSSGYAKFINSSGQQQEYQIAEYKINVG